MSKLITFEEAIRLGVIKEGDLINPESLFSKHQKEVVLTFKETGYKHNQKFLREDLKWFYAKDSKGIDTLWGSTTCEKLYLVGINGCYNGVTNINKIPREIYSNLTLGLVGKSATEKDILLLKGKQNLKDKLDKNSAWLPSTDIYTLEEYMYFCLKFVSGYDIHYNALFSSNGFINIHCNGIRPAVSIYLPSKILVNPELKKKDYGWKLIQK